jgi:hypothetical protein
MSAGAQRPHASQYWGREAQPRERRTGETGAIGADQHAREGGADQRACALAPTRGDVGRGQLIRVVYHEGHQDVVQRPAHPERDAERHGGDVHDEHRRACEDRHATAPEGRRGGGIGAGEQSGDTKLRELGADQGGEEHRWDQLQDHHQARRRCATANVCVDDDSKPLTELGHHHHQVGEQ